MMLMIDYTKTSINKFHDEENEIDVLLCFERTMEKEKKERKESRKKL
jgi:hypothetical protein